MEKSFKLLFQELFQEELLFQEALLTFNRSLIRHHLDHGDVVYSRAFNKLSHQSLDCLQYSTEIAVTRAIKVTSSEKLFEGLESRKSRLHLGNPCLFYKLIKEKQPAYLFQQIPENNTP